MMPILILIILAGLMGFLSFGGVIAAGGLATIVQILFYIMVIGILVAGIRALFFPPAGK